ncbi:MAG: TldD/PmbA family protein [Sandaracinaceae bacterium]
MLTELRERAESALALARRAGAQDAFASAYRDRRVSVTVRDGSVEKLQESAGRGLSIQLYVDGRYASYRTNDLRRDPLARFLSDAVAMTRALERDPFRRLPEAALYENRASTELELADPAVSELSTEQRIEWCMALSRQCRHAQLISATASVSDSHALVASVSSNGFSGHHERTNHWRGASVTLQDEGDARPAGSHYAGARFVADVPAPAPIGDEAMRVAARRLGAMQGPTQRATMVVEPRVAGRLLSLLIGPANAAAFSQQRSFWMGREGERVVSERLTLRDEPLRVRGLGSRYYDGEGISARTLPIIEAGALSNLFVDSYYGRKIERTPTTGSSSNLVVAPGRRDLAAILEDVGEGVMITGWLGGNSDATTGDFSLGARGHRIENGQPGAAIQEMNVTGNLLELFSHLQEVGNDPWPYGSRLVPTLVFDGVQFSGA